MLMSEEITIRLQKDVLFVERKKMKGSVRIRPVHAVKSLKIQKVR